MNVSKLIAALVLALAATSPALAQTVGSCPSVKDNDKMTSLLQLASLDMMTVRSYLKRTDQQPEKINSTEEEMKALEDVIATERAKLSLCSAKSALSYLKLQ